MGGSSMGVRYEGAEERKLPPMRIRFIYDQDKANRLKKEGAQGMFWEVGEIEELSLFDKSDFDHPDMTNGYHMDYNTYVYHVNTSKLKRIHPLERAIIERAVWKMKAILDRDKALSDILDDYEPKTNKLISKLKSWWK